MGKSRFRRKVCLRFLSREARSHRWYLLVQIGIFGAFIWWIPYKHLPWTGVGVSLIAVLAALMSVHGNLRSRHKFVYFALMAALLFTEFRAMRKDRLDNQTSQRSEQAAMEKADGDRLQTMLDGERANTKVLLDQENESFEKVLTQDQAQFTKNLDTVLVTHQEDEKEFRGVVDKEEGIFSAQHDFSEEISGRLVPATNMPVPPNSCLPDGQKPKAGDTLVVFGDHASLNYYPSSALVMGNTPVVSINTIDGSDALYVAVDFRGPDSRILLKVDQDGFTSRTPDLIFLHPNKSQFLIEDAYGREFFRATYISKGVFQVTGKVIYCGKPYSLTELGFGRSCTKYGEGGWKINLEPCPMPPPE